MCWHPDVPDVLFASSSGNYISLFDLRGKF